MEQTLQQAWPLPLTQQPIVIIGTGDIVNDAHLPAYRKANFSVVGIYDISFSRAAELASRWGIDNVYQNMEQVASLGRHCIYDVAVPPDAIIEVIKQLPDGAAVLIQKPMGSNLKQARQIRQLCKEKKLIAAINFQLRFSAAMLAVRDAMQSGLLGEIVDLEAHLNINTPWQLFPFVKKMDRVEISVHSIHYLDLIRSLLGNPEGVFVRSLDDPRIPELKQTRTSAILDYGANPRVALSINHNHNFEAKFQDAHIRFEGTKGCMMVKLGVLMNYPHGEPDELWFCKTGGSWQSIPLQGGWFPEAFIGVMSNIQRYVAGDDSKLLTNIDDAFQTMSLLEACFTSMTTPCVPLVLD